MHRIILALLLGVVGVTAPTYAATKDWTVTKTTDGTLTAPRFTLTYVKDGVVREVEKIVFDSGMNAASIADHAANEIDRLDAFDTFQSALPDGTLTPQKAEVEAKSEAVENREAFVDACKTWRDARLRKDAKIDATTQEDIDKAYTTVKQLFKPEYQDTLNAYLK